MKTTLTQLLTGKDNQTHDIIRWLAAITILVGIALQIYATITQAPFDLQSYGIGGSAMLGGSGVAIKVKESAEPE